MNKLIAHATISVLIRFMGEWQTMKRLYRKGTLYTFLICFCFQHGTTLDLAPTDKTIMIIMTFHELPTHTHIHPPKPLTANAFQSF